MMPSVAGSEGKGRSARESTGVSLGGVETGRPKNLFHEETKLSVTNGGSRKKLISPVQLISSEAGLVVTEPP